ncbi:hypothetical protein MTX78_20580 [Hymenobacter tibetensis]|uniref:Uncharacterized protein n=1 Tax=Hymenobacter tibetensis TaxID=497967 RepID=A0ABY4D082_9BACT|nr:hypothetical protein [Hymenobacter tibetensis]UOG74501.1 hypothetical protein MTX78_20580 [Hymenobacter tibetensis]
MSVLLQSPTRLPLPSRAAAPNSSQSLGLWLLTGCLLLLLIVGRLTTQNPAHHAAGKRSAAPVVLPLKSFQAPALRKPGMLPSAKTKSAAF